MSTKSKSAGFLRKSSLNILTGSILIGILFLFLPLVQANQEAEADLISNHEIILENDLGNKIITFQENTLSPSSAICEKKNSNEILTENNEDAVINIIYTTITAYSSTVDQTNSEPFITASGEWVRDGIVAANFLPFGTKIRIPECFGDKVFVVKDRMNRRYQNRVDVWTTSRENALNFGIKHTYIEVLK